MINLSADFSKKKDAAAYFILISLAALLICIIHKRGYLYGSTTDWVSQSSVMPEYFRQKFYETGKLFPDFAMNLGSGQNIYYFSYYGLFSPILLVSYLLPSISMADYIQAANIAIVIISACLCYGWLRAESFSREVSLIASICFLCAGPVIFHSHRQIMFVDYFPFLFLGLINVTQYFKTHRKWLFILSVFLCIMTSYFFSIGCIIALLIYAVYKYSDTRAEHTLQGLLREVFPLVAGIVIAVLMAAALLLPTIYAVLNGRGSGSASPSLSLLIPSLKYTLSALLYSSYSPGLTAVSLIALIAAQFSPRKNGRVLSAVLLLLVIFPVFSYLLNGTLYARPKVLIPFLPLYILVIALFLTRLLRAKSKRPRLQRAVVRALFLLIILFAGFDCLVVNLGDKLLAFGESSDIQGTGIIAQIRIILQSAGDEMVSAEEYSYIHDPDKIGLIKEILQKDTSFYRMNDLTNSGVTSNQVYDMRYHQTSVYSSTYNKSYNIFYYDILHNSMPIRNRVNCASTKDMLFLNYMDVKYIVTNETSNIPAGYREVAQKGKYLLYENKNTLPFAYATGQTISQDEFDNLPFPYNIGTLFENIVVSKGTGAEGKDPSGFSFRQIDLSSGLPAAENQKNLTVINENGRLHIKAEENASLEIPLRIDLKDTVLIVRFKVSDSENQANLDTSIYINGVKNKLSKKSAAYPNGNSSFVYILSSNEPLKRLTVDFSAGKYEIYDFEAYLLPEAAVGHAAVKLDPFVISTGNTVDNLIAGDIRVTNDGYFATTLPYDKGYSITVDGKTQSYEKVNTAFVGFPIEKGAHHIVMKYNAPYKRIGIALTLIGFVLFAFSIIIDNKRNKHPANIPAAQRRMIALNRLGKCYSKYKEVIIYLVFGVLTTAVNWAVFQLFNAVFSLNWSIANVIAWIVSVVFAYVTNRKYVFRSENRHVLKEFFVFVEFRLVSLLLEMLIMYVLIELIFMAPFASKVITAAAVIIANYIFSKVIVFRKRHKNGSD